MENKIPEIWYVWKHNLSHTIYNYLCCLPFAMSQKHRIRLTLYTFVDSDVKTLCVLTRSSSWHKLGPKTSFNSSRWSFFVVGSTTGNFTSLKFYKTTLYLLTKPRGWTFAITQEISTNHKLKKRYRSLMMLSTFHPQFFLTLFPLQRCTASLSRSFFDFRKTKLRDGV